MKCEKNGLFTMWFLDFVTVFYYSYNCLKTTNSTAGQTQIIIAAHNCHHSYETKRARRIHDRPNCVATESRRSITQWCDLTTFLTLFFFRKHNRRYTAEYLSNLLVITFLDQIFAFWVRDLKFLLLAYF